MRCKTTPPPQQALPEPLVLDPEAPDDTKRMVYLITFPHPRQATSANGIKLVAPSSITKAEMIAKIKDSFEHPVWVRRDLSGGSIAVSRLGCWREKHAPDTTGSCEEHDHVSVLGKVRGSQSMFRPSL